MTLTQEQQMRQTEAMNAYAAYQAAGKRFLDSLKATEAEIKDALAMMDDCWNDDPAGLIDEELNDDMRIADQVLCTRDDEAVQS